MDNGESVLRCLCEGTPTKPSSVIEKVANYRTPFEATVCTQPATRLWNSCWRKPNATRAFTSRRCFMGSQTESRRPVCCSIPERSDPHSERGAGSSDNENTHFPRARASRCQHNASTLYSCIQWVSGPKAKFAANRTGKNDLAFR